MNVIHKIGVILFLLCPYISLYGQEGRDTLTFRIVSYNVENLFDFRHDTLKNDYEFLRMPPGIGITLNTERNWII